MQTVILNGYNADKRTLAFLTSKKVEESGFVYYIEIQYWLRCEHNPVFDEPKGSEIKLPKGMIDAANEIE